MMTDFSWGIRRGMVIDNVWDFPHAILNCKHSSFTDAMPTRYEGYENRAYPAYDCFKASGRASGMGNRQRVNTCAMTRHEFLGTAATCRLER